MCEPLTEVGLPAVVPFAATVEVVRIDSLKLGVQPIEVVGRLRRRGVVGGSGERRHAPEEVCYQLRTVTKPHCNNYLGSIGCSSRLSAQQQSS